MSTCCAVTWTSGASRSSTPGCNPTWASGYAACGLISKATRCSSPTTATRSPTRRCQPSSVELEQRPDAVASFLCVRPSSYTFHTVNLGPDQRVRSIQDIHRSDIWINGGYFVLRDEIFDYMRPGEELVVEPFQRLIEQNRLLAHRYEGFWAPMDTLKDRQNLESMAENGRPPWAVWEPRLDEALSEAEQPISARQPRRSAGLLASWSSSG